MRRCWWLLVLVVGLAACTQTQDAVAPIPGGTEPAQADAAGIPPLLPAYQQEWEKKVPGKADEFEDFRKAHPQWYAITSPPAKAEFRPMREWEPMQAIAITFSNGLTFDDTVVASLDVGDVWVVTEGEGTEQTFKIKMKVAGVDDAVIDEKIKFFHIPNNAFWFIDYGPFPLVDEASQTVAFTDFVYYHYRVLDDAIPTRLGNLVGATTYRSPFPFEGGNFQADGDEFCYYGERVYYLTGLSAQQVEKIAQDHYGCKQAVVLKDITNDGTGHIDMFFKLAGKQVAFVGDYTVVNDPTNKQRMDDNTALLESLVYADGSDGISVYRIPMPHASEGVPRTFINSTLFVSADGTVKKNLWPMYTVDKDLAAEALAVWEEGLPDFDHVGIVSDKISLLSGAVHCVTRTIPAYPIEKWVDDGQCVDGQCQGGDDGYAGGCLPPTTPTPGCWGPAWECLCNDCSAAGCQLPADCGDGECSGDETCFLCPEDCGCADGLICNMTTGDCDSCGDGTCGDGESCLTCPADCGCGQYEACVFGVCTTSPCGGIPYEGCCDGKTAVYCAGGKLNFEDCGNQGCGWGDGVYECGGDHADPAGVLPLDCREHDYPTGCKNHECGDNGAGYSCGECGESEACADGFCEPVCEPDCTDRECGDDGCGGSCGECEEGFSCDPDGSCVEPPPPEDLLSQPDTVAEEELTPEPDLTEGDAAADVAADAVVEEPSKKKSDGCTAGPVSTPAGTLLLSLLVLGLGIHRRRHAA